MKSDTERTETPAVVVQRIVSLPACVSLGEYLKANIEAGVIDFAIRAQKTTKDSVEFYIHPAHVSGYTCDYIIGTSGNSASHVENSKLCKRLIQAVGLAG
jgi:hypothetical protein